MKITAGLGSIDDYPAYVEAGADEVFAGYVPSSWMKKGRGLVPLNRREVLYVNVQIGSESEMHILADMVKEYGVPVTITFNSPFYPPAFLDDAAAVIEDCIHMGFSSFIVADPALLIRLHDAGVTERASVHLSGDTAQINTGMVEVMKQLGISRLIFQRRNSPEEIREIIKGQGEMEYEAFALNEMCHYDGAFCSSLHCDELSPTCRLPYRLRNRGKAEASEKAEPADLTDEEPDDYLVGRGGCGLCALWKLQEAGITHLKLVSRGNYTEDSIRDIKALRKALEILEESSSEDDYIRNMKKELFPSGCSRNCYYPVN